MVHLQKSFVSLLEKKLQIFISQATAAQPAKAKAKANRNQINLK